MTEKELSQLQQEYRSFFLAKLKSYHVNSPAALTKEKKSEFFSSIRQGWAAIKQSKRQPDLVPAGASEADNEYQKPALSNRRSEGFKEKAARSQTEAVQELPREVIRSLPNPEQTDDLKIQYTPNSFYEQALKYCYPVVKMPAGNSSLKLPRLGRSNQKGYKEEDFFDQLKLHFSDFELTDNVHMVIPFFSRPYEPDIVLFDRERNLYIDIEIDEPYDGYYRYPTHNIRSEDQQKQDNTRDLFFNESGWIVIRFTEKQVHCDTGQCISHIRNVLNSIYKNCHVNESNSIKEEQWNENQSIQWQKTYYRENYLGISYFQKQRNLREIAIDTEENEDIEEVIERTRVFNFDDWTASIAFDEETHKYLHPKDQTGNAEYISVTTLIERFFPFDLKRYVERKAQDEGREENDILLEHLAVRDEAAEKGTFIHAQIENFLKGNEFDADSKEFGFFNDFYINEVQKRHLIFFDAEKKIFSNRYNVAGTIDCLFKKKDHDEYVMLDWKRSKKLVIDGRPRIFGYGNAASELSHLDNSSYYRYCLQQNIYKIIAESEFSIKISSMKLVVLHKNYSTYHFVNVPEMKREAMIILNSLNLKI